MANKLNTTHIIFILVVGVIIYVMYNSQKSGGGSGADFTVYGTEWCGYTTKQRDALGDRHVYVDCDLNKDQCKGINGFPMTVNNATGEKHKGFKPNL